MPDLNAALETLRAVCHGPPGPDGWRRACDALEGLDGEGLALARGYAREHLLRWPAEVRSYSGQLDGVVGRPWLPLLGALDLHSDQHQIGVHPLLDDVLRHCRLERLNLSGHDYRPQDVRVLAASPRVRHLTHLTLTWCELGDPGVAELAASPHLAALRHLDLSEPAPGAQATARGATALAESPHLTHLEWLNLDSNAVGPTGAFALAESPHLHRLRWLDLRRNGLDPEGAAAVARSPNTDRLTHLGLAANQLGSEGARAILLSPWLERLTSLDLTHNAVDADVVPLLLGTSIATRLRRLDLRYNQLDEAELEELEEGLGAVDELLLRPQLG